MLSWRSRGQLGVKGWGRFAAGGGARLDLDSAPRLEPRQAALGVLAAYTEVLAAFARKDYGGELDRATHSLGGSVQRLAGHGPAPAAPKQGAGVLATAREGLGDVSHKRKTRGAVCEA